MIPLLESLRGFKTHLAHCFVYKIANEMRSLLPLIPPCMCTRPLFFSTLPRVSVTPSSAPTPV